MNNESAICSRLVEEEYEEKAISQFVLYLYKSAQISLIKFSECMLSFRANSKVSKDNHYEPIKTHLLSTFVFFFSQFQFTRKSVFFTSLLNVVFDVVED